MARTPDATAVVFDDCQLSYAELNERANQLAHHLRSIGVGHESRVAICAERSVELVVGILGILKAGAAYVPLDPEAPRQRLDFMVADTGARVLLTQGSLLGILSDFEGQVVRLDADWPTIAEQPGGPPQVDATARSLAYVMYTSGSTGTPKGVCVEHRNVVRLVRNTNFAHLGPQEVVLQFAPVSFDASTLELWGSLLNGAKLVIFPPHVPTLEELGQFIESRGITTLWLTAALFNQLVDDHLESLAGVRQLLAGGESLSVSHVRRFLETLDDQRRLINGYGPTENTTFTCCHPMQRDEKLGRSVPIGRPIANTSVYILDRALEPVPVGVPGELYAGGDGVARCYLNDAALTAERFVPDPFCGVGGSRMYRTGDLARWRADGAIEFLGRRDHQVKIRGYRIEPGEIEAALVDGELVRCAVVVCREEEPGEKRLVAYVVSADRSTAESIRSRLRERLPEYMIPASIVFLESLPLNRNGKVDRRALPEPDDRSGAAVAYAPPRTATEQALATIWAEVLQVERVGVRDDFFYDLGGHSLVATRVVSRVRQQMEVELTLKSLFDQPTVAELATVVDALRSTRQPNGPAPTGEREEIRI